MLVLSSFKTNPKRTYQIFVKTWWLICLVASLMIRYHHCAISFSPRKWQLLKHLSLLNGFPTAPATRFHSLRVYFQIMVWMGMADDMNPTEWGRKQENNQFIPIMTEKIAAPDELLKIIHCNCSGDANPLDAAADATAPLHCCMWPLRNWKLWQSKQHSRGGYWGGGWHSKLNALKLILWTKVFVQ